MDPDRIPAELKSRVRWAVFTVEENRDSPDRPRKLPFVAGLPGVMASSTDAKTLRTFDETMAHVAQHGGYPAYAMERADGLVFVDIDEGVPEETIDILLEAFPDAYVEISYSGKGLHLLFKGSLSSDKGYHKSNLGLFDHARFVICTGDTLDGKEIIGVGDPAEIADLEQQFAQKIVYGETGPDQPETEPDEVIIFKANEASANGKFRYLFHEGRWQMWTEYPSQSEADHALIGMLAAQTRNNAQVQRLWERSALFRPSKPHKFKYSLRTIRAKQFAEDRSDQMFAAMAEQHRAEVMNKPVTAPHSECIFNIPEGLIRDLYENFMEWAYYPVKEPCLMAALVTCEALLSRRFKTKSGAALNLWMVVLGRAGSGKDTISKGPAALFAAAHAPINGVMGGEFRSDASIEDALRFSPRHVAYHPECASWLKSICDERAPAFKGQLRDRLTDSFTKGTSQMQFRQTSLKKGETKEYYLHRPVLSIYGDAVTGPFYDAAGTGQIVGGFIPRFLVLEIEHKKIPLESNNSRPFTPLLLDKVNKLATDALEADALDKCETVPMTTEAEVLFKQTEFGLRKTTMSGNTDSDNDYQRTLLTRSAEKIIRLATLAAVAYQQVNPIVTLDQMQWAIDFVLSCDHRMIHQLCSGDHDPAGHQQRNVVKGLLTRALMLPSGTRARNNYFHAEELQRRPELVPWGWLRTEAGKKPCFKNSKTGDIATAVWRVLKDLEASGDIIIIEEIKAMEKYGCRGKVILNVSVNVSHDQD
jgi:hypothetical protein